MQGRFSQNHYHYQKSVTEIFQIFQIFISVSKRGVLKKVYEFIFGKSDKKKEHKVGFREILLPIDRVNSMG